MQCNRFRNSESSDFYLNKINPPKREAMGMSNGDIFFAEVSSMRRARADIYEIKQIFRENSVDLKACSLYRRILIVLADVETCSLHIDVGIFSTTFLSTEKFQKFVKLHFA